MAGGDLLLLSHGYLGDLARRPALLRGKLVRSGRAGGCPAAIHGRTAVRCQAGLATYGTPEVSGLTDQRLAERDRVSQRRSRKHVVGDQARCVTLPNSAIKEPRCRTSAMWTLPPSTTRASGDHGARPPVRHARPESQAIRLHHPEVMKAFNNAWEVFFRQGVADHAIKELCRLYISKSVECEYCGGQRSVLAQQQGASEAQVDEILDFENSTRFDERERTALESAMAIAWDPTLAADDLWDRLHLHFTEPQLVELGHFIALTWDSSGSSRPWLSVTGGARGYRCGLGSPGGRAAAFRERGRSLVVARPAVRNLPVTRATETGGQGLIPAASPRGDRQAHAPPIVASGPTASSHTPTLTEQRGLVASRLPSGDKRDSCEVRADTCVVFARVFAADGSERRVANVGLFANSEISRVWALVDVAPGS